MSVSNRTTNLSQLFDGTTSAVLGVVNLRSHPIEVTQSRPPNNDIFT